MSKVSFKNNYFRTSIKKLKMNTKIFKNKLNKRNLIIKILNIILMNFKQKDRLLLMAFNKLDKLRPIIN
jgi:hypothetical protein